MAQIIDGVQIAKNIRGRINEEVKQIQATSPRFQPSLVIIQVGGRPDSSTYVRMKLKAAEEANISCKIDNLPDTISETELLHKVKLLNEDPSVHGVLVQLPLPKHIDETTITNAVVNEKDVDGFGPLNVGELAKKGGKPLFLPCTPKGIMHLLKESGVEVAGKYAVVLGRSDIVGSPVSYLLRNADATVTVVHSKTANIEAFLKQADIVVAAIGKTQFVKGEWLKPGCVVIDVGTNYIPDDTKKSGQRLVGDVDFESVSQVASKVTPVPGGVGPMTVAMLLENVVESAKRITASQRKRQIKPLALNLQDPVPEDYLVEREQPMKPIRDVASEVGILQSELELHGDYIAKVKLSTYDRLKHRKNGKYVLVAGISPTKYGEGKSTCTVGLTQALGAHLNKIAFTCCRQASAGPVFGSKGGAAGGGYSQVQPMANFNLNLTGDIHAVSAAHNLVAAALDARMFHENTQKDAPLFRRLVDNKGKREFAPIMLRRLQKLGINKTNPDDLTEEEQSAFARLDIDPATITWKRVVDMNDRFLRGIVVGCNPTEKGQTRETGFDISVASEVMAVLALCTSLEDMRERMGDMVVGSSRAGVPVTCDDLGVTGALMAIMLDAIKPNLMQTLEGTPVFVHAGPFANISIGASSILSDQIALKLAGTEEDESEEDAGYVVTEAGFDFTMGGERFFNIKCRNSGLVPDCAVIVSTVRALQDHGVVPEGTSKLDQLRAGAASNLRKQIENARSYGVPVVVCINKFAKDTDEEHQIIKEEAIKAGAEDAIVATHFAHGGAGAVDLAKGVIKACNKKDAEFKFLYPLEGMSIEDKVGEICKKMYGADGVTFSEAAQTKLDLYTKQGFSNLPICIAKTQYSLSHDPELKGAPTGFTVPIKDVRIAAGGGYIYALAAEIMTLPGLPTRPGFYNHEVVNGEIEGLF